MCSMICLAASLAAKLASQPATQFGVSRPDLSLSRIEYYQTEEWQLHESLGSHSQPSSIFLLAFVGSEHNSIQSNPKQENHTIIAQFSSSPLASKICNKGKDKTSQNLQNTLSTISRSVPSRVSSIVFFFIVVLQPRSSLSLSPLKT